MLELSFAVYYLLSKRYFYYFHYCFQLLCRMKRFLTKGKYGFFFSEVYAFLCVTLQGIESYILEEFLEKCWCLSVVIP